MDDRTTETNLEPFGHESGSSKIERVWDNVPLGASINRSRSCNYDSTSGLFYSPIEYSFEAIGSKIPSLESLQIEKLFRSFVKGEFGNTQHKVTPPRLPKVVATKVAPPDFTTRYLEKCEKSLVYSDYVKAVSEVSGESLSKSIDLLLSHPEIGNKSNERNIDHDELNRVVEKKNDTADRLVFILPAFPFKDQNYFRTGSALPHHFDMGEIALLARLHSLSIAIYQLHPFGADWIVASDGVLYSDIFGIEPTSAQKYFNRLKSVRTYLNIQGTVSILDLKDIINQFSQGTADTTYHKLRQSVADRIEELVDGGSEEFKLAFHVLMRGMRQNLPNHHLVEQLGAERAWNVIMDDSLGNLDDNERLARAEIDELARAAAISYASENILLKCTDLLNQMFPEALRATVHPKKGQIAVPQLGSCFPWNGVALIEDHQTLTPESVRVLRFHEIGRKHPDLIAHKDLESDSVLFYSPA
ncbi:isocyanide synthase family protein [Kordiimonas aestuarii]|uniref:isocyanide synthase family protein n=1 Tax=Kordiimonas aestuarii TaxID=1005925 RepID=UPI0021CEC3CE|nr:isocyanide synthase family protein [Kordiimonas aestuarii]